MVGTMADATSFFYSLIFGSRSPTVGSLPMFFDLTIVFHLIDHEILLSKLQQLGMALGTQRVNDFTYVSS